MFPVRFRSTGLSLSYTIGVTVFGGFSAFILALPILATGLLLVPRFYLVAIAAPFLVCPVVERRLFYQRRGNSPVFPPGLGITGRSTDRRGFHAAISGYRSGYFGARNCRRNSPGEVHPG